MKIFFTAIIFLIVINSCKNNASDSSELLYPAGLFAKIIGIEFTEAEIDSMRTELSDNLVNYNSIRAYQTNNNVPPALIFDPRPPGFIMPEKNIKNIWEPDMSATLPANSDHLAFYSIQQLAGLLRSRKVTSVELTRFFIDRLRRYNEILECVVSVTEERALVLAERADREIEAGHFRSILHGIPYGVKDLFATRDYITTWGAVPFKDQMIDTEATIITRLEEAGGILVAKLTLGELAYGDVWFGGVTKNPWNPEQGSSGSSAGSASATSAGLVPYAIGTETWGSIVSPSTRCGVTGLRPTFGRVSRYGAMALSWSMDKIGPITRSAVDAAIVFDFIRGSDGKDKSVVDAPFNFTGKSSKNLKVGYIKEFFEADYSNSEFDKATLNLLRENGIKLHEVGFPKEIPVNALSIILTAEAAAAFDELTLSGRDDEMVRQTKNAWPNLFRSARFIPAVEYINANRIRGELIIQVNNLFRDYDVIISPSFGGNQLLATNLTGHPCVVVANGFNEKGVPVSISFLGNLYDEAAPLALAAFYQSLTNFHNRMPVIGR